MILISDGISKTKAMPCYGAGVVVSWKSTHNDKRYQIYVNGKLAGVTEGVDQRQLLINVPFSEQSAVAIEVFAIEIETSEGSLRSESIKQGRVGLEFTKEQSLPIGAKAEFFYDNQSENVDYQNRLNESDISIWQRPWSKGGFGLSRFGKSDFGRDCSAAVGFGKALFGKGEFGFEGVAFKWQSKQLSVGRYKFGIKLLDEFGNEAEQATETETLTLISPAQPAKTLGVTEFDKNSGIIIFAID